MTIAPVADTVRLGSYQVRVRVRGEGYPLLLLNGIGAPLELWEPLVHRLQGYQTIALDIPGSGGSQPPALPMTMRAHARLALALLDELEAPSAHVLGFSLGGMVAQELAHVEPSRVDRLVLTSTSCGWGSVLGSPAALLALSTPEGVYSSLLLNGLDPVEVLGSGAEESVRGLTRKALSRHAPSLSGFAYQMWAAATWSSLFWLNEIRQPTLAISGDADHLVPPGNAHILARLIPGARAHIVRGGGHLCLLECVEEVANVVGTFLSSDDAAA